MQTSTLPARHAALLGQILTTRSGAVRAVYRDLCDGQAERSMLQEVVTLCRGADSDVTLADNRWRLCLWLLHGGQPAGADAPSISSVRRAADRVLLSECCAILWGSECRLSGKRRPDQSFDGYGYPT